MNISSCDQGKYGFRSLSEQDPYDTPSITTTVSRRIRKESLAMPESGLVDDEEFVTDTLQQVRHGHPTKLGSCLGPQILHHKGKHHKHHHHHHEDDDKHSHHDSHDKHLHPHKQFNPPPAPAPAHPDPVMSAPTPSPTEYAEFYPKKYRASSSSGVEDPFCPTYSSYPNPSSDNPSWWQKGSPQLPDR